MLLTAAAALRISLAASLLGLTVTAHAVEEDSYVSAMRYVSLDASGDNGDSSQFSGTGSFTLGKYMWLQSSVGKLTDDTSNGGLGDLQNFGVGAGLRGKHVQATFNFSHYKNDANYKQRDISASFEWYNEILTLGLDGFHRKADDAADYAITDTYPILGTTTIATHAEQTLTGDGFGAHTNINFTDRFNISLGGMGYNYDNDVRVTSNVSASSTRTIAEILERRINSILQPGIDLRSSGVVARNVVPLDSTLNVGLNYVFDSLGLSANYIHDKILDSDTTNDSLSLSASIFIGDHWIVAPTVGQTSSNNNTDDITFGGLSLSYNW